MMAFPEMLVEAATKAGMKIPDDVDNFEAEDFPHFAVFCNIQLGCAINWGEHWENAEAIARIPDDKIKTATIHDLVEAGYRSKSLY